MLELIRKGYYFFLRYKRRVYLETLVRHGLKIGENVAIMDGAFFDPTHCYLITIGDNSVLAPNVRLIAHDASCKQLLGYTKLGKVTIGGNCYLGDSVVVLPGVTIGGNCVVGAGSVVTKDVPPGSIAAGNPCRVLCTRSEWIQRNEGKLQSRRIPYYKMNQEKLTLEQKQEIIEFLDSDTGYVK